MIVKVIVDKSLQIGFPETPWINEIDFTHATGTITDRFFNFWYKEPKKYSTILKKKGDTSTFQKKKIDAKATASSDDFAQSNKT